MNSTDALSPAPAAVQPETAANRSGFDTGGIAASSLQRLRGEIGRFLIVGFTGVAIDFITYRVLLLVGLWIALAKAASFITGAVFAYFANRSFTFRVGSRRQRQELVRFVGVYSVALLANVTINSLALALIGRSELNIGIAFVVATGVSATMNFLGMKLFVFGHHAIANGETGTATFEESEFAGHSCPARRVDDDTTQMRLSLVIPCYNEAKNLPLLVQRLRETFLRDDMEVILVDNGSTDDSAAVLMELLAGQSRIRTVRVEQNQGYGFGILTGLRAAKGAILGWTHADMQTDPADALRGLALIDDAARERHASNNIFVKGRRHGRPAADVLFTVGMSLFETVLLRRKLWDINAQPTMFPRTFFQRWQQPPHDFSLDLFAYYQAARLGLQVRRMPVHFGARAHGTSHWNVNWRAKARFIKRTVDFSLRLRKDLQELA